MNSAYNETMNTRRHALVFLFPVFIHTEWRFLVEYPSTNAYCFRVNH